MASFKVVAVVSWKTEADSPAACLEASKRRLSRFTGQEELPGLDVQVDVVRLKERRVVRHIAFFDPDEVLRYASSTPRRKKFVVDGREYVVKMNPQRYRLFAQSRDCVVCGLKGTTVALDINPGDGKPQFNLYGEENGKLVLMTKDHRTPKSRGGENSLENYDTMCCVCNNIKGNDDLKPDQILQLRKITLNVEKLPRGEVRNRLKDRREQFLGDNGFPSVVSLIPVR